MLFNSFSFIVFFIVVMLFVAIEQHTTKRLLLRNAILLASSYVFYGWFNIGFLMVLLYVTMLNYIAGRMLDSARTRSKTILWSGVLLSLLPLLFYKYTAFVVENIQTLLGCSFVSDSFAHWVMPVGISFFTFQALSYTIDVYRQKIHVCKSLPDFMLFVSFFPTILSGPIEKARNLIPQIQSYKTLVSREVVEGMAVFVWGLFKKIVIADRLCAYVDWAYGSAECQSGATLALAAVLYSIQIYCDFSGYSDMAWGVAKALGFDVTRNFRFPYFATSIKEFWRRWHISLTSWFTEYVYFSLGGNRVRIKAHWIFNISMVFVLSGIWHGASWNFLLWGCLHALYYLVEYTCGIHAKGYRHPRILQLPANIIVFVLVTIAWIFFRIEDFSAATYVLGKIVTDISSPLAVGASTFTFVCNMMLLVVFLLLEWMLYKKILLNEERLGEASAINSVWMVVLLLIIGLCSVSADNFVYFQF